ncbi:hypothetical protein LBMAG15_02190 [Actinomycetes bacterium]|nr:hypothetical protein LBMAG15_02190 [Actinomycetes bacterium]
MTGEACTLGGKFASSRLALGLTTADLAEATNIRESMLVAMEAGDFDVFGADVYARGHLKVLAARLGLDPEALLAEFEQVSSPSGANPR